jgi:ABC-type transport auxiliary lipoprotein component
VIVGPRSRFPAVRALGFAAALAATGCVLKPPLATRSYSIDPPATRAADALPAAAVVSLLRVRVAAPYAGMSFVYRTGEHRIERDPYALFAAPPGWMLTAAIGGYLRDADFIRDVVDPASEVPSAAAIEADATELCADLDNPGESVAVLTLRFRVMTPASGKRPAKDLLLKTYAQRIPMPQRTAQAAADAWNQALAAIMKEFLADLKVALAPRR